MNRVEQRRFYSSRSWRSARFAALQRGGWLCAECKREGFTVAAAIVHHVDPLHKGGAAFPGPDGTRLLCRAHHEAVHNRAPGAVRAPLPGQLAWRNYLEKLLKEK